MGATTLFAPGNHVWPRWTAIHVHPRHDGDMVCLITSPEAPQTSLGGTRPRKHHPLRSERLWHWLRDHGSHLAQWDLLALALTFTAGQDGSDKPYSRFWRLRWVIPTDVVYRLYYWWTLWIRGRGLVPYYHRPQRSLCTGWDGGAFSRSRALPNHSLPLTF